MATVIEGLEDFSVEEVMEQFDVTREQITAVLEFVAQEGLARALTFAHTVHTAQSRRWDTISNGALLGAAEEAGFELLLTTDRRIRHQQDLRVHRLALVVLTGSTRRSRVREHADRISAAVAAAAPGRYTEVNIPFDPRPRRT